MLLEFIPDPLPESVPEDMLFVCNVLLDRSLLSRCKVLLSFDLKSNLFFPL